MCGIMAYTGANQAYPVILKGLQSLEYRGYDSAGIAIMHDEMKIYKKEGKVNKLSSYCSGFDMIGHTAIGHTRWATHGVPSDTNSHPHVSQSGRYAIVHNGIIENYEGIKSMLIDSGFEFQSDTDSEVLIQLIDWYVYRYNIDTLTAIQRALDDVEGSFALVVLDKENPDSLFVSRRQSPLVLGLADDGVYASSDPLAVAYYTDQVIFMEEDIIGVISADGETIFYDNQNQRVTQHVEQIQSDSYQVSRDGYDSYMLKEIIEQPDSIRRAISTYVDKARMLPDFGSGISDILDGVDRIVFVACGTSYHSGLLAEYLIEQYAHINVEVEIASELRYKNPLLGDRDLVIGISQSGETADSLAALEIAKTKGAKTLAFVNRYNSSIARMVDEVVYLQAGPEISVASTKAFTSQVTVLSLFALEIALRTKRISEVEAQNAISSLTLLPSMMNHIFIDLDHIKNLQYLFQNAESALYLGRSVMYPLALEGALKLKEISYIHAEGYAGGEMKHGPIALVDSSLPVIALLQHDTALPKMLANIQEVKSRDAKVIIIKSEDVEIPDGLGDYVVSVPTTHLLWQPLLQTIPLQLISYYVAKQRGCDIDQPRNLAKSVTVE